MHDWSDPTGTYAVVAEFDTPEKCMHAAEAAREAGYSKLDAYSPFPIHGMSEAIGFHCNKVPFFIFAGGLLGCMTGLTLQWYTATIDYPLNVGGKPFNSLPSFMPVTFECTILFSAFTAVFGMLALNKLPKPYHSIFNTPNFGRASQDRFFLAVEHDDPNFNPSEIMEFLQKYQPLNISEVEH